MDTGQGAPWVSAAVQGGGGVQNEYTYLGVRVHATKGLAGASDALVASGCKAMHALLTRCRRSILTQLDIKTQKI